MNKIFIFFIFFVEHLLWLRCLIQSLLRADMKFTRWHQNRHEASSRCRICSLSTSVDSVTDTIYHRHHHHKKSAVLFQHFAQQIQRIVVGDSQQLQVTTVEAACELATLVAITLGSPFADEDAQKQPLVLPSEESFMNLVHIAFAAFLPTTTTCCPLANTIRTITKSAANFDTDIAPEMVRQIVAVNFESVPIRAQLVTAVESFADGLNDRTAPIYWQLTLSGCYPLHSFVTKLSSLANAADQQHIVFDYLKLICCLVSSDGHILQAIDSNCFQIYCLECGDDEKKAMKCIRRSSRVTIEPSIDGVVNELLLKTFDSVRASSSPEVRSSCLLALPTMAKHRAAQLTEPHMLTAWTAFLTDPLLEVRERLAGGLLADIFVQLSSSAADRSRSDAVLDACRVQLRDAIEKCLADENQRNQSIVVRLVRAYGMHPVATEERLIGCFMMLLLFVIHVKSAVGNEAMLAATEACARHGTNPEQLLDWYKDRVFELLVQSAVANFMQHNMGLAKTFYHVSI